MSSKKAAIKTAFFHTATPFVKRSLLPSRSIRTWSPEETARPTIIRASSFSIRSVTRRFMGLAPYFSVSAAQATVSTTLSV